MRESRLFIKCFKVQDLSCLVMRMSQVQILKKVSMLAK